MKTVIKFFGFVFGVIAELFVHGARKAAETDSANSTSRNTRETTNRTDDSVDHMHDHEGNPIWPPPHESHLTPIGDSYWGDD